MAGLVETLTREITTLEEAHETVAALRFLLSVTTPAIEEIAWRLDVTALAWFGLRADLESPWPELRDDEPM